MNKDQIYGVLRQLGVVGITWLLAEGYVTGEQASTLISAAEQFGLAPVAVGLVVYGVWKKRDAAKALAADKIPGVTVTVDKNTAPQAVVEIAKDETNAIKLTGHQ